MLKIVFRADGNSNTGLGHLYRCCALSEIVGKEYQRTLITRTAPFDGFEAIAAYFDNVVSLASSLTLEEELKEVTGQNAQIVVLDGYRFDTEYQKGIKERSDSKLVCIDDIYAYRFLADVVINHAGGIVRENYDCEAATEVFLGVQYAIIRPLFGQAGWTGGHRPTASEKSILITYGAADPDNRTKTTLSRFVESSYEDYELNVVVGAANKYRNSLLDEFSKYGNVKFHLSINASSMLRLMQRCSICVASPSTVSLEYLNSSSGMLVSDVIADNQKDFYRYLVDNNFSLPLESYLSAPDTHSKINVQMVQETFDGHSSFRLNNIFKAIS